MQKHSEVAKVLVEIVVPLVDKDLPELGAAEKVLLGA